MIIRSIIFCIFLLTSSIAFACSQPYFGVPDRLARIMNKATPLTPEEITLKADYEADKKEFYALMSRGNIGCSKIANSCTPACNMLSALSFPYEEDGNRYDLPKVEREAISQRINEITKKWWK